MKRQAILLKKLHILVDQLCEPAESEYSEAQQGTLATDRPFHKEGTIHFCVIFAAKTFTFGMSQTCSTST
jgi:hypothetical protein